MQILVLNLGSTSFKFELFDLKSLASMQKGDFELDDINNINKIFREMLRKIGDLEEIKYIGHRVVHGGEKYNNILKISPVKSKDHGAGKNNLAELEEINSLAPLHNPFNLAGIRVSQEYLPDAVNYAVFDTALYKDLPEHVKIYPINII